MKVVGHVWEGNTLQYQVENSDEQKKMMLKDQLSDQIITEYWTRLNAAHAERQKAESVNHRFTTGEKKITKIIDVVFVQGEKNLLCEFRGLNFPVLVPSAYAKNNCPKLFIDFCEKKILSENQ